MLLQPLNISATTGDKPQSKVWSHSGHWWVVLPNSSGTKLWKLQDQSWVDVLHLSDHTDVRADTIDVGNIAHILLYRGQQSILLSLEFSAGNYQFWPGRPAPANITLGAGVETATIEIDSLGRMWLAYEAENKINVQWSDSPYAIWQGPTVLATGVKADDICVVSALPTGQIGVLWSNQNIQRFGFRLHVDGANPTTWSADEVPASQSAQPVGGGMADDHLNVAVAGDGTLYAAVKTEYETLGFPTIALLIRRPSGSWDNLYEVDQVGTRPIVLLNILEQTILVVYTADIRLNPIIYKTSDISSIAFSGRQILLETPLNNVTSTKENYTDEVLVLASNDTIAQGILFSPESPGDPLIGFWKMEEGGGTVLVDASNAGNNGTIFGNPTWVTGVNGLALRQDGSEDYSVVPNSSSLNITNSITLVAWVKPEKQGTQRLIRKVVTGSGYSLFLSGNGWASVRFNGSNSLRLNSNTLYPTDGNTWIHIAATYDGSTIRLYINGIENSSTPALFNIINNSSDLGIGAETDGNNSLQGALDDVRIYNRALSSSEIQNLATFSNDPLIGFWKMNEGSGTILIDASNAGNNGTIFGNPSWVTGVNGLALRQDGSGDYSVVPNSSSLNITDSITLVAWVKPEKQGTQRLIRKVVTGSGYSLFLSGNGWASVRFNGSNSLRLNSNALYPTDGNTWIHIAVTYDGSTIQLYINGVQDNSTPGSFNIINNSSDLSIGAETDGNNSLQGALDDVLIYNRALSSSEIQDLVT